MSTKKLKQSQLGTDKDLVPVGKEDFSERKPLPRTPAIEDYWIWKPDIQHTFLPRAPAPAENKTPIPPEDLLGEQLLAPSSPVEDMNKSLNVRQLIVKSLKSSMPLRIIYTTLDGGLKTERTIHPDYVYWAGTNRHILIAWDELRGDWRAFSVDNVADAKLTEKMSGTPD